MHHFWTRLTLLLLSICSGYRALPTTRHSAEATAGQVATVLHVRVRQLLDLFIKEKLGGDALMGEHQLATLPELAGSAADLESVQADETLPKMSRDLRTYERHLTWLRSTKPIAHTALDDRITEVLALMRNLANRVEQEMRRLKLSPSTAEALLPSDGTEWATLRAGFVILRDLRTFINKTAHELLVLKLRR
ncbi:interleukin-11 [Heterodontus francisci]|uniref:interleukin-11 n=1 Tax=Heterodontus francisci TaxID=7792 RepID=UPI00355BEF6E